MKLLIAGDTVPTPSNYALFEFADLGALVGNEIENLLIQADLFILNLEAPLVENDTPIAKCGPNLRSPTSIVKGVQAMKPGLISLANNHIMDHGEQGLRSTLQVLKQAGIPFTGVGDNLKEASEPHIIDVEGQRIGIYCCAEHEFSISTDDGPGANPFDPLESLDHIVELKSVTNHVIVLYHGGKEHYRYPSPDLQKVCRKMVDKGADLVICQHSHCIGCKEEYKDAIIIYGQGNFIFDDSESEFWRTSLLIELSLDEEKGYPITFHPIVKNKNTVRMAEDAEATKILNAFFSRSEEIKQAGFVERQYKAFADQMLPTYLMALSGSRRSLLFRAVNKLSGYRLQEVLMKRKYGTSKMLAVRNFVECEAHRELLLKGLAIEHE